jgi:hypothetical protein
MVEHIFWCLDEDNQVFTPGDRDRVERLLKQLPDRTMWLKAEFKIVANFFHGHTGMWWFPCMRDNGKKVLVSKTLKDTFRRKSQYEICRGWCPFGNYADQYKCELWDYRYKHPYGSVVKDGTRSLRITLKTKKAATKMVHPKCPY